MESWGHITIITGSMFAGKSNEIARHVRNFRIGKVPYKLYTHAKDNERYETRSVCTHNGISENAIPCSVLNPDGHMFSNVPCDTVLIFDECQFFSGLEEFALEMRRRGNRLILAGLLTDFMCNPFGELATLLPHADEHLMLRAVCQHCHAIDSAIYSAKQSHSVDGVGGMDEYSALCSKCYGKHAQNGVYTPTSHE